MKKTMILLFMCLFLPGLVSCSELQDASVSDAPAGSQDEADEGKTGTDAAVSDEAADYEDLLEEMRLEAAVNPWGDTQALSVTEEYSGVSLDPPGESCLPEGLKLETYRYTEEIIEARYTGGDNELVIRKSNTKKDRDLSGDHNTYSEEQLLEIQGVEVTCCGDGSLVNLALYNDGNGNFSISYNAGEEGRGLSEEELQKLIEERS